MEIQLCSHRYGKAKIRVMKILREGSRHTVLEVCAQVLLEGDFASSFISGDNSKVVATDTIKNTVHALAKDHFVEEVERFAIALARHFTTQYGQVKKATVELEQRKWDRMKGHDHAFSAAGAMLPWTRAVHLQGQKNAGVTSGFKNWLILKSTQSGFSGYPKCKFTTLPETEDRIMATSVTGEWVWSAEPKNYNQANEKILEALSEPFLNQFSPSVQTTMYQMGENALKRCAEISQISLAMPNQHCLLFDLERFGMSNPNIVFTSTSEPHGQIEAVLRRT